MRIHEVQATQRTRTLAAVRRYKFATAMMALVVVVSAVASAQTHASTVNAVPTQNVSVVNTPSVNATVSNTASNPVPSVDVEKLARIPFQYHTLACGQCELKFNLNKPGYRVVIEDISFGFILNPGATEAPLVFVVNVDPAHGGRWAAVGKLGPSINGHIFAGANEKVLAYFEDTDPVSIQPVGNLLEYNTTLTGYYENCAVTGCPPILTK